MADKWTKEDLIAAAKDFNQFIDPDSPIPTDDEATDEQLENDIRDIIENDVLLPEDKLYDETLELLVLMGLAPMSKEEVEKKDLENITLKKEVEEADKKTRKDLKKTAEAKKAAEKVKKEPAKAKGEAADKKKTKKEGEAKEEVKKAKYTRAQAFCDALKGKAQTITEIAEEAKELHGTANPNKKQPQLMSIEWAVRDYIQPLVILGFVIEKNKKYSLK